MFQGDIQALARITKSIEALTDVPSRASGPIADRITKLLRKQFRSGQDPYGRSWRGLAQATIDRGRHNPPLTDTGASRDDTFAAPLRGAGIRINMPRVLWFHQDGFRNARTGRRVVARPVLPKQGLPAAWRKVIDEEVARAFRESTGRR